MRLFRADASYLDRIYGIEVSSFSDPWSKSSVLSSIVSENMSVYACEYDGCVCGFITVMKIDNECEILNLAVAPDKRRRKIADTLLSYAIDTMKNSGVGKVYLEVRSKNLPARSLYEKYGFIPIGQRPKYYQNPVDDAVLMKKNI